jgi:hypothetical protein
MSLTVGMDPKSREANWMCLTVDLDLINGKTVWIYFTDGLDSMNGKIEAGCASQLTWTL